MLLAALPIQAQTENQAFYIYQNDGHFDGFFYDEIEKMSFSFLDTLGVEHDEIVSQEIFTADSVYRIMLSAIDSIGFVQPETKYGPQVYIKDKDPYFRFAVWDHEDNTEYGGEEVIIFSRSNLESGGTIYDPRVDDFVPIPQPQVGDIYASFDLEDGFMCKISEITRDYPGYEGWPVGYCKPIDDITEVFQQFVAVEEYGYDDEGTMVRRRVAGLPDMTVGNWNLPKKSSNRADGTWEGDLFNFSLNSNIPLYASDNLNVNIITAIEGKLHVKTTWNLSLFGDKYINILTKLNFGVAGGFGIDGSISKTFDTGLGELGSIPVPAACPILCITIGPDVFLRGEAHVNFTALIPKAKGSFWTQLEINNWVPRMDMGFGTPEGMEEEEKEATDYSAKLSLNGFVQAGLQFPLTFGSLPTFKKFFNFSAGSKMYLGPKLGADFTIDLKDYDWDTSVEGTFTDYLTLRKRLYTTLLNTKLQLHMLDVDFDIKSKMKTAFSGVQEATLFSGSASLLPALDLSLVPKFGNCEEYTEDKYVKNDTYGNQVLKCRVFAFKPSGLVIKPVVIGAGYVSRIMDDGTEDGVNPRLGESFSSSEKYYHVTEMLGQELPKDKWARLFIPYREGKRSDQFNGKFKVYPVALFHNGHEAICPQGFEFEHGAIMHVKGNSINEGYFSDGHYHFVDTHIMTADGNPSEPLEITGNCDSLSVDLPGNTQVQIVGSDGNFSIEKHPVNFKNSYNPCDTIKLVSSLWGGVKTIEGEVFETLNTDIRRLYVYKLPTPKAPKTCNISFHDWPVYADFSDVPMTVTKLENGRGWHFSIDSKKGDTTLSAEFDIWYNDENMKPRIVEDYNNAPRLHITKLNITVKESDTHSFQCTLATPERYYIKEVQEGFAYERNVIPFDVTETTIRNGKTETKQSSRKINMDYKISF